MSYDPRSKKVKYPYPSRYGSHAKMLVEELPDDNGMVLLRDEYGEYLTHFNRLDDGLADPARYAESRISYV